MPAQNIFQKPWVKSVSVALLTQSAVVVFEGASMVEELVKVIDSLGYEARLERVDGLHSEKPAPQHDSHAGGNTWRAVYSIGGMTCSSCIGTIAKALDSFPWMTS